MKPYRAGTPASMSPRARQNTAATSPFVRAPSRNTDFPWLLADVTARNQRGSGAGVRPMALSPYSYHFEGQAPAVETLQETKVKPLYRILLKNRKIQPPAYPEPVHLVR